MGLLSGADLREWRRRLAAPIAAVVVFGGAALFEGGRAGNVRVPFDPEALVVTDATVTRVVSRRDAVRDSVRRTASGVVRYYLDLPDYPGVEFRASPTAGVSELRDVRARLTTTRDPDAARETHRRMPNVTSVIDVVGLVVDGRVLMDPEEPLRRAQEARARHQRLAWICALGALSGVLVAAWRARRPLAAFVRRLRG